MLSFHTFFVIVFTKLREIDFTVIALLVHCLCESVIYGCKCKSSFPKKTMKSLRKCIRDPCQEQYRTNTGIQGNGCKRTGRSRTNDNDLFDVLQSAGILTDQLLKRFESRPIVPVVQKRRPYRSFKHNNLPKRFYKEMSKWYVHITSLEVKENENANSMMIFSKKLSDLKKDILMGMCILSKRYICKPSKSTRTCMDTWDKISYYQGSAIDFFKNTKNALIEMKNILKDPTSKF